MADITITGNIGKDPNLRWTPNGQPVLNFSVCDTKSKPDGNGGWQKLKEQWFDITVWDAAEFWSEKLGKGDRVRITGEFYKRDWEKDGRSGVAFDVTAEGVRLLKKSQGGGQGAGGFGGQSNNNWGNQPAQQGGDPWATPGASDAGGWGTGPTDQEPPF
jgi:single-strand DNA-binding protein